MKAIFTNSRTIQSATKCAPNRSFKPELQYFSIDYCCQYGGRKYQPKSTTGIRPNQRLNDWKHTAPSVNAPGTPGICVALE
ncbi:uncharacterized protein LOC143033312 isoform X3 [Oratosquilla oratoria]|uniref:uncharacterized protein LOC143033312 isoform X3 n=1 Tax=Oratosquilla oratoria TaxID=337810 RepID=UPI003F769AC4